MLRSRWRRNLTAGTNPSRCGCPACRATISPRFWRVSFFRLVALETPHQGRDIDYVDEQRGSSEDYDGASFAHGVPVRAPVDPPPSLREHREYAAPVCAARSGRRTRLAARSD